VGSNARSARAGAHCAAGRLEPIHDTRLVGHLRFKQVPLTGVIVASWVIAFVEYCMAVPTNRRDVTPDLRLSLARIRINLVEIGRAQSRSRGGCRRTSAQDKLKYRAPRRVRSNQQAAIMGLDNRAADRQAHSHAA
jgi:hypothetical protein